MKNKDLTELNLGNLFIELAQVRADLDALVWLLTKDMRDALYDDFQDVRHRSFLIRSLDIYEIHALNPEKNQEGETVRKLRADLVEIESKLTAKGLLKPLSE